jgi:hypothetical protein
VNNLLENNITLAAGGGSSTFNGSLGTLGIGDVIYVAEGGVTSGDFGSFQLDYSILRTFELPPTPEPSTFLLGALGAIPVLRQRRWLRRQKI